MYANVKSLSSTSETNIIIFYFNYISIKIEVQLGSKIGEIIKNVEYSNTE